MQEMIYFYILINYIIPIKKLMIDFNVKYNASTFNYNFMLHFLKNFFNLCTKKFISLSSLYIVAKSALKFGK